MSHTRHNIERISPKNWNRPRKSIPNTERNPQLSTIEAIASNLDVNLSDLFASSHSNSLHSIIVHDNTTYIADDLNSLINNVKAICAKEGIEL